MKFIQASEFEFSDIHMEVVDEESMTEPDQSMSIPEIIDRFVKGGDIPPIMHQSGVS